MKKALIIEDNPDIRENIAEILEFAGFQVITSENGMEGISLARTELPDVILCDVVMPQTDGYGVLQQLRQNLATAHIPFIYVSALVEKAEVKTAFEKGADGYVCKPFEVAELMQAIEKFMKE